VPHVQRRGCFRAQRLLSAAVLVAEPNTWLNTWFGSTTAGLVVREDGVGCVAQEADREGLLRGAALRQPELVLTHRGLLQREGQ